MDNISIHQVAFDASPVAIVATNVEGNITLANKRSEILFGYTSEALRGKPIASLLPDIDRETGTENNTAAKSRSAISGIEMTARRNTGSSFSAEVHAVTQTAHGETIILWSIADISSTKKLLTDLRERVKEQRCLLRVTEALFTADSLETIFAQCLSPIAEGWQYPEKTQVCIKFLDGTVYQTENFTPTQWALTAAIKYDDKDYGMLVVNYSEEMPSCDQTPFLAEERKLIDTLAKLFSIFLDQWHTMNKLRKSESLIRQITDHVPVNTYQFEVGKDGSIIFHFVSKGMDHNNLSLDREAMEADPKKVLDEVHPDDRDRFYRSLLEGNTNLTNIDVQYRIVLDGGVRWRWLRARHEKTDNGRIMWYGSTQDITQIVEYIGVLEQILFDISHVIRKPVTTMLGLTDLLAGTEQMDEKMLKDFANNIKAVAEEMDGYVRALNDIYQQKRVNISLAAGMGFSEFIRNQISGTT